ncbi:MAG: ketosteroid isomerase [Methylophaga nitratireducenticrescens]|uniref:nuclear transport factor 2 family protein n=1 Tax=Methylophaga sp. SB9B TaxID=2570356 RepID=UPI0010A7C82E|nr:ketosteroid isomerase [Methylophaga sp. SB9B]THF72098.1 MAG: ketosteroid isomerase [Methylophaga nitratireducenticrescens]THK41828.1 ketosteroid isomerase [Methylophaga sp. SB9B]
MKTFQYLTVFVWFYLLSGSVMAEPLNDKQLVENAFNQWSQGIGSPFDLLTADAQWTIMGPTESAKTYNLSDFQKMVIQPFNQRLATRLKPTVHAIYQDSEEIIILFEAEATLINGENYQNSYAWFFTMQQGKVVNVRAVLDLNAYDAVMALDVNDD